MKKTSSVRMNFIMNFILTISNFIFPLITFPYVSRVLGADRVGTVTFATSIISYFSMVGMLGIPTYGIRACAKVRDNKENLEKTVQEIVVLNAIVMLVSIVFLAFSIFLVPRLAQEKLLYLILSSTLLFNVTGVDWLYKALEKYSYITVRSIIFKFLSLVFLLLLIHSKSDYVIYGAISVLASVGSNFLNFINLHRFISLKFRNDLNIKQHIKPTLSFFLLNISTVVYNNLDTTMVGFIKGDTEVGYYSAAVKIEQILVSVVTSLGTVLLPRLSYYYGQNKMDEFRRLVRKALNFVLVISIPLTLYFIIVSKESILFLSGQDFLPAVLPMQLILLCVVMVGLSNLMGIQILVPTGREKLVVISTVIGALFNIIVNSVAIPYFGAAGSAFAGSVAELTVTIVQFYFLRDLMLPMLKSISFWKILIAALVSVLGTLFVLFNFTASTFIILVITAIVFFGIYGICLLLLREEFITETISILTRKFRRS
ncbi:flippase [Streptococcus loxodontisalivarius]|uniref:O-antigen/teichoic acid export membrane protein n=1 Tax=Streptococcus loxodontisalivarius TaxID=1349415 RepID=A0ABS2PPZ6_9STRE|nr:flippase [Streptococcus loxodontisalivarius]MBM7641770.1 O-antigen/teichoic acid export membrane protein [Streptococcus loxodontisalivarius]